MIVKYIVRYIAKHLYLEMYGRSKWQLQFGRFYESNNFTGPMDEVDSDVIDKL